MSQKNLEDSEPEKTYYDLLDELLVKFGESKEKDFKKLHRQAFELKLDVIEGDVSFENGLLELSSNKKSSKSKRLAKKIEER